MHQTDITVRWGELDPYNHVNHAVYSSYLEHARVASLEHIDRALDTLAADHIQIVVVRSDIRFRAPATAGDRLTILTRVAQLRGASMVWHQRIHREADLILTAEITAATVSRDGRPIRMPAVLREALDTLA